MRNELVARTNGLITRGLTSCRMIAIAWSVAVLAPQCRGMRVVTDPAVRFSAAGRGGGRGDGGYRACWRGG